MNCSVSEAGNRVGMRRGWGGAWLNGLAAFALAAAFLPALQADEAKPDLRAARLSAVEGQVRVAQGTQTIADRAVPNSPLFEGMRVETAEDGRAEIQFEDGSVARLSPNSSLAVSVLRQQPGASGLDGEVLLESGLAYFELQNAGQSPSIRVRFGDSLVTAGGFTVLRVNLDSLPGEIAVFSGNARLDRGNPEHGNVLTLEMHGGESVVLSAEDPSRYNLAESIEPDSWDAWNADMDQALTASGSTRTKATGSMANSANPAWGDLDANGSWYNVPDQGYVWSPNEAAAADWDPYGNGYWMWTPQFGNIWVSGYAWGYMPYQCGMWNFYDSFGWGWAPGTGGCRTWWGTGYLGPNIGLAPGGYQPPRWPHRIVPRPPGSGRPGPHPLIAINRPRVQMSPGFSGRNRNAPASIAGYSVQPLRGLASRPQYNRSPSGVGAVTRPQYDAQPGRSGQSDAPANPGRGSYGPAANGGPNRHPAPSSTPGLAPRAAPSGGTHAAAPSHPASGGSSSGSSSGGGKSATKK
jgi:hypothetical protein